MGGQHTITDGDATEGRHSYCACLQITTAETANYLMMGREVRLPEHLAHLETLDGEGTVTQYAAAFKERLRSVREPLRAQQTEVRIANAEEPSLYTTGDQVWLKSYYKKRGHCAKLLPKYVGYIK